MRSDQDDAVNGADIGEGYAKAGIVVDTVRRSCDDRARLASQKVVRGPDLDSALCRGLTASNQDLYRGGNAL